MTTGIYLEDHPPARSQFRKGRRARPTGLIVVHTAESALDTVGPDGGAEAVAGFIQDRDTPGSYHRLSDADSTVKLVRFSNEAYGDGTGSNPIAIHLSFACRTVDWERMSPERRARFIANGAEAAVEAMEWLEEQYDTEVPLERVTKAQSDAGRAGFIAHGTRDPGRRSDPGVDFPWDEYFAAIRKLRRERAGKTPNITGFRLAKTRKGKREWAKRAAARGDIRAKAAARAWLQADVAMTKAAKELIAEEVR